MAYVLFTLCEFKLHVSTAFSEFDASDSDHIHEKYHHHEYTNNAHPDNEAIRSCVVIIKIEYRVSTIL